MYNSVEARELRKEKKKMRNNTKIKVLKTFEDVKQSSTLEWANHIYDYLTEAGEGNPRTITPTGDIAYIDAVDGEPVEVEQSSLIHQAFTYYGEHMREAYDQDIKHNRFYAALDARYKEIEADIAKLSKPKDTTYSFTYEIHDNNTDRVIREQIISFYANDYGEAFQIFDEYIETIINEYLEQNFEPEEAEELEDDLIKILLIMN